VAMSNHFLFFVRALGSLEKRACFSRPQPTRPPGSADLDSFDSISQLGQSRACGSRLITYETRSTTPQPIRPGNHTTTLRLMGKARRATEGNLEVIATAIEHPIGSHLRTILRRRAKLKIAEDSRPRFLNLESSVLFKDRLDRTATFSSLLGGQILCQLWCVLIGKGTSRYCTATFELAVVWLHPIILFYCFLVNEF
jgi:hypothetical protein